MPKSLHEWLHYSALKWMMPVEAVQEDHGGIWRKGSGVESWKHLTQSLPTRQPSRRRRVPTHKEEE